MQEQEMRNTAKLPIPKSTNDTQQTVSTAEHTNTQTFDQQSKSASRLISRTDKRPIYQLINRFRWIIIFPAFCGGY